MKKLANRYRFERNWVEAAGSEGEYPKYEPVDSTLFACYPKRDYKTKMMASDLPEWYCQVWRCYGRFDVLSSKGVKDIYYTWVKENHFMKDSVLHVSYTGNLEPYREKYTLGGKEITSVFTSYTNDDEMVFEQDILKFLAYAHKYSGTDLSKVRKEFVKQCKWLAENEPEFAPDLKDFKNYGEWFDNKIKTLVNHDN